MGKSGVTAARGAGDLFSGGAIVVRRRCRPIVAEAVAVAAQRYARLVPGKPPPQDVAFTLDRATVR
jgi:hypothetical protein